MAGIQTEHCVEIRVPCVDEDPDFGSGYSLGPHWVLTAHHVLFSKSTDESQPIEISWWDSTARTLADEKTVSREDIVWYSERHDIALVRCPSPCEDVPSAWDIIARERPAAYSPCHCAGYLSGLENEAGDQRRKTPAGTLGAFSKDEISTDLDLTRVQLKKDKLWRGFSGSAVFSGGRLAALVREVNTGESGRGLTVSFIAPALDAEGDRPRQGFLRDVPGFLVDPGTGPCWERLRPYVVELLDKQPALRTGIEERCRADLPPGTEIRDAAALAQFLYESSEETVIDYFLYLLFEMMRQQDRAGVRAVENLARVWLSLLAAGQGALPQIDGFRRDPDAATLPVEAAEPILLDVESQAAEAAQGEPLLQLSGEHLRSPLDLTPRHNTGLDSEGRVAAQDAKDALALKTRPGMEAFRAQDAKEELERHVTRPETGLSRSELSGDDAERGRAVSKQLRRDSFEYRRNLYIRIPAIGRGGDADALKDLHRWSPELLVFEVEHVKDPQRSDALRGLHQIIYRSQRFLSPTGSQGAPS